MADVIQIAVATKNEKRKALVIDLLERMLAEAKEENGFETGFFIATYPDSTRIRQAWTENLSAIDVVGRIEHLKHEILADMHDDTEPCTPPPAS